METDYSILETLEKVKEMWNKCTKEEIDATPYLLPTAAQIPIHAKTVQAINEMRKVQIAIKTGDCPDAESATRMLESASTVFICEKKAIITECLLNPTSSQSNEFLRELESKIGQQANIALTASAIAGVFVMTYEFLELWKLWDSIKNANNIVESSKAKREMISKHMSDIPKELNVLSDYVSKAEKSQKMRIRTQRQMDKIRCLMSTVEKYIGDLEYKVNNQRLRIEDGRSRSRLAVANTLVHTGICAINALTLDGVASPWLVALNYFTSVGNLLLTAAKVHVLILSQSDIEKLTEELEKIENIKNEYNRFQLDVNNAIEAAFDRLEDYASGDEAI